MRYVLFFLVSLTVLALGFLYVGKRLIGPSGFRPVRRQAAWIFLGILFVLLPGTMAMFFRHVESPFLDGVSWFVFTMLGLMSFVFLGVVTRDALILVSRGLEWLKDFRKNGFQSSPASESGFQPERRRFLIESSNVAVIGAAGLVTGYGIWEARRQPSTVEVSVPLANLPTALEGFRILQITDLHVGLTVKKGFVETVVEQANDLNPDLVVFTGDMADGSVPYLRDDVSPLSSLQSRYGSLFITGNHEYYSGAEQWIEEADRIGFKVLLNQHHRVQHGDGKILFAGVTDYSAGQFIPRQASNPAAAVAHAPEADVRILLAHQPRSVYAADPFSFDLQISGHTHGGQFFPWNLLAAAGQPYISGLHQHNKTLVYVSRGTGYWGPPVRVGARSEITVFRLTRSSI